LKVDTISFNPNLMENTNKHYARRIELLEEQLKALNESLDAYESIAKDASILDMYPAQKLEKEQQHQIDFVRKKSHNKRLRLQITLFFILFFLIMIVFQAFTREFTSTNLTLTIGSLVLSGLGFYMFFVMTKDEKYEPLITGVKEKVKNTEPVTIIPHGKFYWDVSLRFPGEEINADQVNTLMFSLSSALSHIEGVEVVLVDWGRGSFWVRWRLWFKNLLAQETTKEVLEKGKEAAIATLEDKSAKVGLTKAQAKNIDVQAEINERKLQQEYNEEEAQKVKALNIRKLEAEVKQAELANREKEVDIRLKEEEEIGKKIGNQQAFIDLIAKGLREVGAFEIHINGVHYLIKKEGKFEKGEEMAFIERLGKIIEGTQGEEAA